MKLSDYKGEAALDKLAEIIEPLTTMLADPELQEIAKQKNVATIKYAKPMLKNHKAEIIEILAALDNEPVETYRDKVTLFTLPAKLLEFLNDSEVQALFHSQAQSEVTPLPNFGPVMENTGAKEN